jgi:protein phosphatase
MTTIRVPELSLIVLVGSSGSGKSTFAARHFKPTEVISSDFCRGLVGDDENDQSVTAEAFEVLHAIAGTRLGLGRLTVVDATNVQPAARKPLIELARRHHVVPVAIVLDVPEKVCIERNRTRPNRSFGGGVVRRQQSQLRRSMGRLEREGFRRVVVLRGPEEVAGADVQRERAWADRSDDRGPFDVIGDVHGCHDELARLLSTLGYETVNGVPRHSEGRTAVFLGDVVDRGPATPAVLRTVMAMVDAGSALCVPGNHEDRLVRALKGRKVQVTHGLGETLAQLGAEPETFRQRVLAFLDGLVSHYVLDGGRLVVAHAGMREEMQGRASAAVRAFALYGETTGETDEFGLPVRFPWASEYRGSAIVVYGHTPTPEPVWTNDTICIDTGCVFGGALTALRYPEKELVSVPAERTYYEPIRPLRTLSVSTSTDDGEDLLDVQDVLGKRGIETRLHGRLSIPDENAAAALEVMSRFAVDPRWLVYLPPTMAPTPTAARSALLEHPADAFAAYRRAGVPAVMCQEKHMGSRAVVIACRDRDTAVRRFRIEGDGVVYTRTGRPFFPDRDMERAVLAAVGEAIGSAGLWEELSTDWLALDCELMPWSLKAEELVRSQYASVGGAATASLGTAVTKLAAAIDRGLDVGSILRRQQARLAMTEAFIGAYRPFCWPVGSSADLRVAPFLLLAGEGGMFLERDHAWHMGIADRLAGEDGGLVVRTGHVIVDLADASAEAAATVWWEELTSRGSEGIVVKPLQPVAAGRRGLVQPGIKVRGPEYLRLVYGPEYSAPSNLGRLRERSLNRKRSLALREFALGVESLERFVRREPLHRVHECVFGVLALESEPVDPRL